MRRVFFYMMLSVCLATAASAQQRITRKYDNVSISEALRQLNAEEAGFEINFLYNELEDFRITTSIDHQTVPDAIRQMIGFYPIRMTVDGTEIFVECPQKTSVRYRGNVIDDQGMPVAYANVALLSPQDSTLLAGGVSNESGLFIIPCETVPVLARISFVGYKTVYQLCSGTELGTVRIQPQTLTLKGVTVEGKMPQYSMITGGITVDIQNSVLKDVGTADDVLSMLPGVEGSNGNFTVFAKGTPEIYINNKKVQNAAELKLLKSAEVKSVDIITSPGAKYNAETDAVIRIKTVKRTGDSFSVGGYSQVVYNGKWTTYDDVTVKYRTAGLEVYGNMMVNHGYHKEDNTVNAETRANGSSISICQTGPNDFWYTLLGGQAGASYDFNESHSVGFSYSLNGSPYEGGDGQLEQTITRNGILEDRVSQTMHIGMTDQPRHESNIYYVGKVGKLGIDFNGSQIWKKSTQDHVSVEQSLNFGDLEVHSSSVNRSRMYAGKLVLAYPVWKGELSAGTEMSRSNSHGLYENTEKLLSSSNDEIKERNLAGFAEYQMNLGGWTFGAGLRYESVKSRYYSFGQYQTGPSRSYHDFFPNLSAGWKKNKLGIQLNYNKRISRPYYNSLISNVQYDNRYFYEGGNPLLRPTVKQNADLGITYAWLHFNAGYARNKDIDLNFGDLYRKDMEVVIWRRLNFDKLESYHASLSASPKFGFYSPTLTVSYFQQNFDTQASGVAMKLDKPEWQISFRNWFTFNKTAKAMLYLHYATSYDYGFMREKSVFNVDARVQKTFLDGSLTAAIHAGDIFRTLRNRWTGYYAVSTMSKEAYSYTQNIGISLSYNFNAARSRYKGTGAGNAEKSRL